MASSSELQSFIGHWLPRLEEEMQAAVTGEEPALDAYYGMLRYHLGWADADFQPQRLPAGKRLRPILCLLACQEAGGDPVQALPAAAALELLHNFSLIHDDVEDGDEVRRHRPTVWKLWGVPQAINAGDALFSISFATMQRVARRGVEPRRVLAALETFTDMCIALTQGQHLDISFEQRSAVSVSEYLRMIQGKTAALIGAAAAIGGQLAGAADPTVDALRRFGRALGLAFQIQDDILGIWGDPAQTGKAAGNDILRRKKSLPLLYALQDAATGPRLAELFACEPVPESLPAALALLEQAGARSFAEEQRAAHHEAALSALADIFGPAAETSGLWALAASLLHRRT